MAWEIQHEQDQQRYAIYDEAGSLAGYAAYESGDTWRDFNHTVVLPKFRGQGVSQELIAAAVKDTEAAGKEVVATCSAVQHWLAKRNA